MVRFACISSSAAWQVKLESFGGIKVLSKVSLSSSVDGRSMLVIAWALFFFFFSFGFFLFLPCLQEKGR